MLFLLQNACSQRKQVKCSLWNTTKSFVEKSDHRWEKAFLAGRDAQDGRMNKRPDKAERGARDGKLLRVSVRKTGQGFHISSSFSKNLAVHSNCKTLI